MVLLGTGAGLVFPSVTTLAMSGATPSDAGLAGGLLNTSLQVGGALGLAVLASLSATRTDSLLAGGDGEREVVAAQKRLPRGVAAGLVVLAVVAALAVLRSERAVAPEQAAEDLHIHGVEPVAAEAA